MKVSRFEEIIAWKKAKELTVNIYRDFRNCRDFSFKNQIERAAVSIMNNIAEGFERQTNKELRNFFFMAKGSCGEVRSMLNLALELNYLDRKQFSSLENSAIEISKILSGFIKTL